jgi:hypothetical protein
VDDRVPGLAITALRQSGDGQALAHVITKMCTHTVDIAAELATLDANGYRPLRMPRAPEIGGRPRR